MCLEKLTNHFLDLVSIASPSFQEQDVFDWYSRKLQAAGFQVELLPFEGGSNLYAFLPAAAEHFLPVLLSAHADTVIPCDCVKPVIEDGTIRSDGSTILGADNKAALAIFLDVLETIREKGVPHGQIELLITAAEEVGLKGAQNFDYSIIKARHCIVMDASGAPGLIVNEAPGHSSFRITVRGRKAHAGIEPEKGVNAISAAARIVSNVPAGRQDRESVANWGTITGGEAGNIVPDMVILGGEVRSHRLSKRRKIFRRIESIIRKTDRQLGSRSELEIHNEYGPYSVPQNHEFVRVIQQCCKSLAIPGKIMRSGGCSDANIIHNHGIECLNLGCGMRQIHTAEEHIRIADMKAAAGLLHELLTGGLQNTPD